MIAIFMLRNWLVGLQKSILFLHYIFFVVFHQLFRFLFRLPVKEMFNYMTYVSIKINLRTGFNFRKTNKIWQTNFILYSYEVLWKRQKMYAFRKLKNSYNLVNLNNISNYICWLYVGAHVDFFGQYFEYFLGLRPFK